MKKPDLSVKLIAPVAGLLFSVSVLLAADEICSSCSHQVSVTGSFAHRQESPSVVIEGAGNDAAAFREDVNGTNFTVSVIGLPAGKYAITIRAAETVASGPGRSRSCRSAVSAA